MLPVSDPVMVKAMEPWAYFKTKGMCDYWQEQWSHNNGWLEEYGVVASPCVKKDEEV